MRDSDDVSRLFAMFGEKKEASHYREVYEDDQSRATLERWPLFQRIRVGAAPSVEVASSSTDGEQPEPFVSPSASGILAELRGAAREVASDERRHAPVLTSLPFAPVPVPEPAAPAKVEGAGNLCSLFKRLQGSEEQAVHAPVSVAQPEQPTGSIRSLFNRLSRP